MAFASFFDLQPEHIRELVLQQVPERTAQQMVDHLLTLGVETNVFAVRRYRHNHGVSFGWHRIIEPADTYDLRTLQYIVALSEFNGKIFGNRMLGAKGAAWARCARRLCDAGLIKKLDGFTPVKYTRLVTDDVISAWYEREVGDK